MNSLSDHYTTVLNQYSQWLNTLGYAPTTRKDYTQLVGRFMCWLIEKKNIHQFDLISTTHIAQYFTHLQQGISLRTNQALSPSHLNNTFTAIDKFCTCLHQLGMQNPPSPTKYRVAGLAADLEVLSQEEVSELYTAIEQTYPQLSFEQRRAKQVVFRLILDLCYGCGLRAGELFNLRLKDVRLTQKTLHIRQSKNYRDRYVPMSKTIVKNTQDFIYNYRRAFTKRKAMLYPHVKKHINYQLRFLLTHASSSTLQNKRVFPHLLRHSIATHLLQKGMEIEHIRRFLGHRSLNTTQLYTHIVECLDTQ